MPSARRVVLVLAFMVATPSILVLANPTPSGPEAGASAARPSAEPWSSDFETYVCAAVTALEPVRTGVGSMRAAIDNGRPGGASREATDLRRQLKAAKGYLRDVSPWAPARQLTDLLTDMIVELEQGLADFRTQAAVTDATLNLGPAMTQLETVGARYSRIERALRDLQTATGFRC